MSPITPVTSFTSIFSLGEYWLSFVRDLSVYVFEYTAARTVRELLNVLIDGNPILSIGVDIVVKAFIALNPLAAILPIGFVVLFWLVVVLLALRLYMMFKSLLPIN